MTCSRECLILLALCLIGCAGSLEQSRVAGQQERRMGLTKAPAGSPERCAALDDRRQLAGLFGKSAAVLAGASGLAVIPADDPDQRDLRVGLAVGSAAAAAVAAGAMFVAEAAGETYVRECQQ